MIGQIFIMPLKNSEKLEAVLEIGKLEHSEVKILYQVVIGAIASISAAVLIAVFQHNIQILDAVIFLLGFYEVAFYAYLRTKKKLNNVRYEMIDSIRELDKHERK